MSRARDACMAGAELGAGISSFWVDWSPKYLYQNHTLSFKQSAGIRCDSSSGIRMYLRVGLVISECISWGWARRPVAMLGRDAPVRACKYTTTRPRLPLLTALSSKPIWPGRARVNVASMFHGSVSKPSRLDSFLIRTLISVAMLKTLSPSAA